MRKRLAGALAASLIATLFAAGSAYADHGLVNVTYQVTRGSTFVTGPFTQQDFCGGTFCNFNLVLANREYGRFTRWCGPTRDVVVPANVQGATTHCFGGGQWVFSIGAQLRSTDGSQSVTHPGAVTVRVIPLKQ